MLWVWNEGFYWKGQVTPFWPMRMKWFSAGCIWECFCLPDTKTKTVWLIPDPSSTSLFECRCNIWSNSSSLVTIRQVKWKWSCSVVSDSATPWSVARQAPLPMVFYQARVLEWGAITFSGGSFPPRNRIQVSSIISGCFTIFQLLSQGQHLSASCFVQQSKFLLL